MPNTSLQTTPVTPYTEISFKNICIYIADVQMCIFLLLFCFKNYLIAGALSKFSKALPRKKKLEEKKQERECWLKH